MPEEKLAPILDEKLLGDRDAIVVMKSRSGEWAFSLNRDMTREAFLVCCEKLREITLP
jgi:hypothetical protein